MGFSRGTCYAFVSANNFAFDVLSIVLLGEFRDGDVIWNECLCSLNVVNILNIIYISIYNNLFVIQFQKLNSNGDLIWKAKSQINRYCVNQTK